MAGFGPFKTAGDDRIFPALLKNRIEVQIRPLHKIFRGVRNGQSFLTNQLDIFVFKDDTKAC
jgi:hypothetical protein